MNLKGEGSGGRLMRCILAAQNIIATLRMKIDLKWWAPSVGFQHKYNILT